MSVRNPSAEISSVLAVCLRHTQTPPASCWSIYGCQIIPDAEKHGILKSA